MRLGTYAMPWVLQQYRILLRHPLERLKDGGYEEGYAKVGCIRVCVQYCDELLAGMHTSHIYKGRSTVITMDSESDSKRPYLLKTT